MSVETEISNQLFSSIPEKSHIQKPIKILTDRQVRVQSTIDQAHQKTIVISPVLPKPGWLKTKSAENGKRNLFTQNISNLTAWINTWLLLWVGTG